MHPQRPTLTELALSRRTFIQGGLAGLALAWTRPVLGLPEREGGPARVGHDAGDKLLVPEGYAWRPVLRWGDPILPEAAPFDPQHLTAAAQEGQFGYDCDFLALLPLPREGPDPDRALLAVNHEQTDPKLMLAGWSPDRRTVECLALELAAHGMTIVELRRRAEGGWEAVPGAPLNRRITGRTPTRLSGPAAGTPLLRTAADPEGRRPMGTLANCSGGVTPWGTVLSCEENFQECFQEPPGADAEERVRAWHRRYGVGSEQQIPFATLDPRFSPAHEPHEPFRFGWVVEVDPHDPASIPTKRTALGRFRHEGAATRLAPDGRVVVYMGDDGRFECLYKFVSRDAWDGEDRTGALLDHGTLHVARFAADGTGEWLPLVHGQGPLVADNGFHSQGDVAIAARVAADLLGATPLDRPEGVVPSPTTGKVYMALTNNTKRKPDQVDAVNPRASNASGQVVELSEDGGEPTALRFRWEHLFLGGDPGQAESGARYGQGSPGWLSCPDNLAFGPGGRLFVTTDGQPGTLHVNDGLYAVETEGPGRGNVRQLVSAVPGAECTGPCPTPDGKGFLLSIQHPGEGSTRDQPSTRFPDYQDGLPPRPTVIAIWRKDDGAFGG